MYSTAADYFRFAQMLLNGGELDGKRLLKASTVEMMRTNVLSDQVLDGEPGHRPGAFFSGAGVWLRLCRGARSRGRQRQVGKGSYWWWGIGGTWFWIDPTNDLVMVGIIQRQGGVPGAVNHEDVAREAVSAALTAPAR